MHPAFVGVDFMSQLAAHGSEDVALLTDLVGRPNYDRRLADKVLAAFNHAYAVGAHDVAATLRDVLASVEAADAVRYAARRTGRQATDQADRWVAFVEARNRYRQAVQDAAGDADAVERAMADMKQAYRNWSAS